MVVLCLLSGSQLWASVAVGTGDGPVGAAVSSPIRHVVVILEENHSFDNVFGFWCARTGRCDGTRRGRLSNGSMIRLGPATDVVPRVKHGDGAHRAAWHHGAMNGFDGVRGCRSVGVAMGPGPS